MIPSPFDMIDVPHFERTDDFKAFYIEVHLEMSIIIENDLQQIYSRYHNCLKRYPFNSVRFQT